MDHMPNMEKEHKLSQAEVEKNEKALNAKNKLQFALALDILRSEEKTSAVFNDIHDENQLMEPNPEHPEIEQYVNDVLARIRDDVRNMIVAHPEVVAEIVDVVGDSFDYPLNEINLTHAKKYLPAHFKSLH